MSENSPGPGSYVSIYENSGFNKATEFRKLNTIFGSSPGGRFDQETGEQSVLAMNRGPGAYTKDRTPIKKRLNYVGNFGSNSKRF